MKKNNLLNLLVIFLLILLFISVFFINSQPKIISYEYIEKSENTPLDYFEITLNYEDLSNTKVDIISTEKTYSFLNPEKKIKFFPKEYGKHEINFYKEDVLLDSSYFIYANENSIYTDKTNYSIGEQVTISIISTKETKNFILELIDNNNKKYNLFSPSSIVKFIPNSAGNYKINLIKDNNKIAQTEFYVESKEIEPINYEGHSNYEIVKTQLKIKPLSNLTENLGKLNNSLEITGKNKKLEYELEIINSSDLINENNLIQNNKKTKLKLKNSHIKEIEFSTNFQGNLKIDEPNIKKIKIENQNFNVPEIPVLASYAIDPRDLEFENATIKASAKGNQLWKCKDWDFNNSLCLGRWEKILDLIPGEDYTFVLDKQDPGFIETGIASINTNKPIYLPNETVKLDIVIVNKYGYLADADINIKITNPLNQSFDFSETQITKIQKGIYELNFSNTNEIGLYEIEIIALGNNVNSTLFSYFFVNNSYDFDIIRKAKQVIDPKNEYFISEINIDIKNLELISKNYNFTEVLPESFEIIKTEPNAEIIIENNTKKLIWRNLYENSKILYIAQPPIKSPELYQINSYIEYEQDLKYNLFKESRPWFLAIDPRAVSAIFVYKDTVDSGIVKYRIWNSSTNSLMPEQNGPNVGSPPTWQTIKCMKEAPLCLLVAVQADTTIDFAYYNESNNQWSSVTNLGTVDDDYKSVDIACEDLSGNCLIAYETSTAANNQFAYRIFNATSQTLGAQNLVTITAATANAFRYINLYPKYNSNQIAIVLQNLQTGGGEYEAAIWNGSESGGFIDWQELYADSGDITKKTYSCSWEGTSNDLICFYVRDTITGLYAWNYNSLTRTWTDLGEVWPRTDIGQEPANIFSCGETPETGDLNHDSVMVMFVDRGADRLGSIWNGTNFLLTIRPTQDGNTEVSRDDTMACSWTHDGNTNVMAWVDADSLIPEWGTYSYLTNSFSFAQWDVGSTVGMPTWADDVESLRISLNPENDEMLLTGHALTLGTIPSNVNCTRWTGSTFDITGCENVETTGNLDITSGREFTTYIDVDWFRYNAPPLVSALIYPLNNSNITTSNVNFTFIVSDDIALRNCSIYLNNSGWQSAGVLFLVKNGQPSNLTLSLADDKYTWNVLCYDSSTPSKIDWYDYNYTFTLDASPPNITNLNIEPEKQLVNLFVNISVNVSDYLGIKFVIAEITYPNLTIKNFTMTENGNIFNLTFTETTQLGLYNLTIHSEDLFGNKNSSIKSNFNISLEDLYLETDKNTYIADETVYILGKGFYPNNKITLYLYDPTGDPILGFPYNVSSNLTGGINSTWIIPNNPVLGYYKLNATDTFDKTRSINISFRIVSAIAETDKTNYEQGDFVLITGYNWDPYANITINITDPNNQQVFGQINLTANSTGNINTTWQIPYNATLGNYNLRAFQTNDLSKKSSYIFSVSKRNTNLSTDFDWYYLGDTIYVLGYGFSPESNITVYVYDNTGSPISHFPKNYTSNNTGAINFSFVFPIELYEDTFYINATDLKYPNLYTNTSFMIVSPYVQTDKDYYSDGETVYIYGYYFPRNKNITINITDVDSNLISGYPKNVSSDNNGFFTDTTTAYSGTLAQTPYDVLAFYPQNPNLQSLYTYYVLSITSLSTDKKYYTWWEIVNITGKSYSETSYVDVFIKDLYNSGSVLNYPQRELTNSLGRFNHYFNVSNYCPTDLNIIGTDVAYPDLLNASTNITIRGWWNSSWQKRIPIYITNLLNENRTNERIFVNITGLGGYIKNCINESRIISTETWQEIPLNVIGGDNSTFCEIVFLANITANKINDTKYYYYYNNSNAKNPNYPILEGYYYQILYDGFDGTTDFKISAGDCLIDGTHECIDSYPWDGFDLCRESDAATAYGVCASPYMGVKGGRGLWARGGLDQNTAGDGLFYYLNSTPCNNDFCHNIFLSYYEAAFSLDLATEGSRVYVNDSTTTLTISSCQNAQPCESTVLATTYLVAQYVRTDLCRNYTGFNCNNNLTLRFTSYNPGTDLANNDYIGWDEINLTGYRRYAPKIETTIGEKQNYVECEHIDITPPNITINYPQIFSNTSKLEPFFNFTIIDDYSKLLNYSIYVNGIFNGQKGQALNNSNITLNITGLSEGRHYIIIEAIDKFSNAYNSTKWNITIDITPPNTTITTPVNFTNISSNSFLIEADAIDNLVGVDSVLFFYRNNSQQEWQFLCSDNTIPYRCTWDISLLQDNNTYQLKAYANDTVGNNGLNYTVGNITIDRNGPITLITEPWNYTKLNGSSYLIKVNVTDLLSRVDSIFILYRKNSTENWINLCVDKTYPYECLFNYENLEEGNLYEIRAYSNDSVGNYGLNDTIYNLSINMQGPNITNYNASPLNQKLGLPVQIFANITDKTAVSYAYANIVMPNGTNINLSMADDDLNSIYNTTFYQTYLIGTYNVSIYSNDTFNNINNTETFTFNITYDSLNLYTNKNKYVAGEYVLIYGSGFNAFSNITIYIYNSTNDTLAGFPYDVISNSTGGINLIWVIPIDLELEYYYINATDKQDINRSITTSFEIVSAIIETDKLDYQQGNPVFIFGNYFDENEVVYVNITNPLNELVFEINLTANSTGNINTTWYSDFNETIGNYILSAQQISNPLKKDTYEFTISQRSVYVFTDYPFYKENEIVNVLGYGFSFNPTEYIGTNVSIYIYDQDGISILGYPINLTTNASGNFNYFFIINNLNEGNYTINVTDLNYPNLNNFTKFEVALSTLYTDKTNYINGEIVNIYGSYWTKNTKITIDIKNESGISITGYPKNITSSNLGNISDSLIAQAIGYGITTYKIIAFNPLFNKENATINFTVQRKAILETEKSVYDLNELINISGFFFSQNSPVEILIRYLNNSGFAYYYPKTIISNVNGDITHQFNNTYLCTGSYIIEATDKTFTSLYANTTFNISFINKNSTIKPSYNATASGLYSVFANYGNSYQSDNTYEYFGGIDLNTNFNAFLNYSFNLSSLNTPIEMIHNLSFVLEYCHSGVQTNPLCNQGYPHEGIRNGDQMIAIYNFSNNQWFNLTNLTVNSLSDAENTLIFYLDDLTYNLSNFIQNNILHLQIEMDFNQTGVQDDLLVIDYLAINISYYSYVSRDCKALTTKFFEINNLNKTNKLIPKTNFTIYNSSLNLIDTGNNPYFRYLPEDKLYFEVFSHFVNDNISYFFYNLSFDSSINLTAQINENYNYSLPNFSQTYNGNTIINNVLNITPLISVKDDYISFEKAQLKIPKRGLDINTILHCKNYNYLTSECLEFEVNETDEFEFYEDTNFIYFNVSSFDSFGGGVTASIPNITNISIYNVTGLSDTHTGGILIANSLNTTFNLTQGVYRIQFRIYNAGRRWDIVGNDVVYHSGLNNTWFINTTRDIWYVDSVSTTNRTGGNFTNGKVVWNTSQLGRINAGAVGYFYYVVNITTNKSETYQVYFLINDTSSRSGSYDYSAYKIKDTIPPYIVLNTPLRNDNLSYGNVLFNFSVFDNSDYNLTCNLSINQNNVLNNINSRNKNTTIVYYTLLNSGVYNWSVSCIDIDGNYNVSEKRNFTLISGPEFIDINITETNTSIRLNWSSSLFADSYSIFITTNYSAGFSLIPNVTGITSLEWVDNNAFANEKRYYKIAAVKGNAYALSNKTAGKQTMQLYPNWNLISVPFNLTEWQIFNGTHGRKIFTNPLCIVSIWRYNSSNQSYEKTDNFNGIFIPSIGSESFTHLENGKGYWFEVDKNCNLTFYGIVPDNNSTYELNPLWNIMGHYSAKDPLLEDESIMKIIDVQPEDSVQTIVKYNPLKSDFEVSVHYPGFGWWPSFNNQDFIYLNPMLGYYFDVLQKSNWTHDPNKG